MFNAETEQGVAQAFTHSVIDFKRDPWPKVSDSAKDLVKKMFDPNPKRRLSYTHILLEYFALAGLKHDMVLQSLLQHTPVLNELELELQNVRLAELVGMRAEVEFIEFVLSSASRLESLIIKLDSKRPGKLKFTKRSYCSEGLLPKLRL
ncbi:hypothetical protein IEQ34_011957 [Dendrobium chrysotoxum]|uniref:Uncharacterized protein n=1 Tax=Dendrobium chrysotoxum TaxID=161865 RepID=A0AAV7GTT3_DENCH|nr:hypothetical protein IEQ34_011957 [Dendrobium chrysotoxum]